LHYFSEAQQGLGIIDPRIENEPSFNLWFRNYRPPVGRPGLYSMQDPLNRDYNGRCLAIKGSTGYCGGRDATGKASVSLPAGLFRNGNRLADGRNEL
jgi:hypothetical protein